MLSEIPYILFWHSVWISSLTFYLAFHLALVRDPVHASILTSFWHLFYIWPGQSGRGLLSTILSCTCSDIYVACIEMPWVALLHMSYFSPCYRHVAFEISLLAYNKVIEVAKHYIYCPLLLQVATVAAFWWFILPSRGCS